MDKAGHAAAGEKLTPILREMMQKYDGRAFVYGGWYFLAYLKPEGDGLHPENPVLMFKKLGQSLIGWKRRRGLPHVFD